MKDLAQIFKALGDETRLEIVRMLAGKELCVCDILDAFAKSQPAISHHLKILRQAGLVIDTRDGKWIYYSLNGEVFHEIAAFLARIDAKGAAKERCVPMSPNRL